MELNFLKLHSVAVKFNLEIQTSLAENLTILDIASIASPVCPLSFIRENAFPSALAHQGSLGLRSALQ